MSPYRILVVENDKLFTRKLVGYLQRLGHTVVACVTTCEEALVALKKHIFDIILLDASLRGKHDGIAVAEYKRRHCSEVEHIFLSNQTDRLTLQKAKMTSPAGFLSKPLQYESLHTTMEIAMHQKTRKRKLKETKLIVMKGNQRIQLDPSRILFLEADHVYVRVRLDNGEQIIQRNTLGRMSEKLPVREFISVHRSYIVNIRQIDCWSEDAVVVGGQELPLSRSRRKEVLQRLESWAS